jgi:hypothetical protein
MMGIKKKGGKKKVSTEVTVRRPREVPSSVWGKMGPRQRFNLVSGLLSYDSDTRKTYRTDLRGKVSKKVIKKKSVRKKVTKKTRRVDWLKSVAKEKLVMTSGEGSFHFDDGSKYTGQIKNGLFHGIGIRVWEDGTIFNGDWKDGVIQGHGRIIYPGGVEYIGSWKKGVKSGRGTLFRKNGTMFTGDWEDGLVKKPLLEKPKFITQRPVSKKKVGKKEVGDKILGYGREQNFKPGIERIDILGLTKDHEDRLKKNYILTLRDLTRYSSMDLIEICKLPSKTGLKIIDQIQKGLKTYGLRMKSNNDVKYVDITTLSLAERRRLNRPGRKKMVQLDKWGIYHSKKYW